MSQARFEEVRDRYKMCAEEYKQPMLIATGLKKHFRVGGGGFLGGQGFQVVDGQLRIELHAGAVGDVGVQFPHRLVGGDGVIEVRWLAVV